MTHAMSKTTIARGRRPPLQQDAGIANRAYGRYGLNRYSGAVVFAPLWQQLPRKFGR
jgi:hypothetical protein